MFDDEEPTVPEFDLCCEASCESPAMFRCVPDEAYPLQEDETLEVLVCSDHIGIGLSYPASWPKAPKGWRIEHLDEPPDAPTIVEVLSN